MNPNIRVSLEQLETLDQCNEVLSYCKDVCRKIVFKAPDTSETTPYLGFTGYVWVAKSVLHIQFKVARKLRRFSFRMDGAGPKHFAEGGEALGMMNRMATDKTLINRFYQGSSGEKQQRLANGETLPSNSIALLWANPDFGGKETIAWEYDINSAYGWAATMQLPDIRTMRTKCLLKEGEIGFVETYAQAGAVCTKSQKMVEGVGIYADYAFQRMESPYKHWAEFEYNKKNKTEKGSKENIKAKDMLVMGIGQLANVNPFVRNAIVEYCNTRIARLIDENTIYCNTDSIVSAVPRPDIEEMLGDGLGQFKLTKAGVPFRLKKKSVVYQWKGEAPKYRGIPSAWFAAEERKLGREYNLLTDEVPTEGNAYVLDQKKLKVVKAKEERR